MSFSGDPHARPSRLFELTLWGTAGILALSAHVGLAAYLLREPEIMAADNAPPAAIMIELAPEPVAEQVEETVEAPDEVEAEEVKSDTVEPVEEPEPEPLPEPVAEPEPEIPEEIVEETPPEPVIEEVAEPLPEELPEEIPEPVEQELAALEDVEVPLPVTRPPPEPEPEKKVEEKKKPEPKKVVRKPEPKKQQASEAAQVAKAQTTKADRTAAQQTTGGSGMSSVSPARWQSRLMAHLERRKKYPAESRSRREQGTAYVRFQIDAGGNVLSVSLSRSSGFAALDQEVLAMVKRASPVPAPPPGVNRTVVAPVMFTIR